MEAKTIDATSSMLLGMMRNMLNRGEISVEDYATSLRRAKKPEPKERV